jgi:hypothetical protein
MALEAMSFVDSNRNFIFQLNTSQDLGPDNRFPEVHLREAVEADLPWATESARRVLTTEERGEGDEQPWIVEASSIQTRLDGFHAVRSEKDRRLTMGLTERIRDILGDWQHFIAKNPIAVDHLRRTDGNNDNGSTEEGVRELVESFLPPVVWKR